MPKVKMPRSSPSLDMTPLVDLAFLLVTFFILTSSFRQPEPVTVDVPTSTNDSIIPKQVFLITIDKDGRTFVDLTYPAVKGKVFMNMCKKYQVNVTKEDSTKFVGTASIGLNMNTILDYLSKEPAERGNYKMNGVPYDTTAKGMKSCQLFWWASYARVAAFNDFIERKEKAEALKQPFDPRSRLRFAVKADAKTKYNVVQAVIQIFREAKIKEFEMITGLEDKPSSR
jgi:biopolymer transport protein ExbD